MAAHQSRQLAIATARAGNVIGGGDWAEDRIVPDSIRALADGIAVPVRNPQATRLWKPVLEPLGGYLRLAEAIAASQMACEGSNPYADAAPPAGLAAALAICNNGDLNPPRSR